MAEEKKQQTESKSEDKAVSREKARYWVGVLYPENMLENWEEEISELVELPYAYCIHDKDMEADGVTPRKAHVHLIIAFSNTTTYSHALRVFKRLGDKAVNTIQSCINIRHKYDYLIHNTEDCKKKHKHLYEVAERKTGNNFDIGSYEQISTVDKDRMCEEIADLIIEDDITNFRRLYLLVKANYGREYFSILKSNSSFFRALVAGNWQAHQEEEQS